MSSSMVAYDEAAVRRAFLAAVEWSRRAPDIKRIPADAIEQAATQYVTCDASITSVTSPAHPPVAEVTPEMVERALATKIWCGDRDCEGNAGFCRSCVRDILTAALTEASNG